MTSLKKIQQALERLLLPSLHRRLDIIDQRTDAIFDFLKSIHTVEEAHPATGVRRLLQLSNVRFLRKVTDVLDTHGIGYWLTYGTLLGAVRHQGFIPWDDDIDIAVLRADYRNLSKILRESFTNDDAVEINKWDNIRVRIPGTPCQIDIFPFDMYEVPEITPEVKSKIEMRHADMHSRIKYDWRRLKVGECPIVGFSERKVEQMTAELLNCWHGGNKLLMVGVECGVYKYTCLEYDYVFPLREITFEGFKFKAPAKTDIVLFDYYGEYANFPNSFGVHADIANRIDLQAYLWLKAENSNR